jgi:hypothetical protein
MVSSAYIAAFALAICIGHAGARQPSERFFFILFSALALAAFLNVPIQIVQWYQWYDHSLDSILMLLVTPIKEGSRPSGMILQPNQLATVQVWGLIGLSWLRYRRSIGSAIFFCGFCVISFGIGLTQSRAGLLEMLVVFGLFAFAFRATPRRDIFWTWAVMIAVLVIWALNFIVVAEWLGVRSTAVARLSAIDGARIDAWRAFWAAIVAQPWVGYGITDVGYAYVAMALERPEIFIGVRFAHAHSVLLDLLLWVGLPFGVLVSVAFLFWLFRRISELSLAPHTVFPLAVVISLVIHAMLELPHYFLYFIVPAGFFIGWLSDARNGQAVLNFPRQVWGVAGVAVIAATTPIVLDYFPYQERYTEWRYENQRVGKRPDIEVHKPIVLNQIHDELILYRLPLRANMPADQLQWISDTAKSINSPPAYYAAAKAFALAGRRDEALLWMMRFNAIMDAKGVQQTMSLWLKEQVTFPELADFSWPAYSGRKTTFIMPPQDASPNLLPTETFGPLPIRELTSGE